MKKFRQFFTIILLPVDYFMVLAAFLLAYQLKLEFPITELIYIQPFGEYAAYVAKLALLWPAVFFLVGLYRFRGFRNKWELLGRVIEGCSLALAIFIIGLFLTKTFFFSRLVVIYFWPLSILLVLLGRSLIEAFKTWLNHYSVGRERVILIAKDHVASDLSNYLSQQLPAKQLVQTYAELDLDKLDHKVDRIILGYEDSKENMVKLIRWCEDRGVALQCIPSMFGIYTHRFEIDTLVGYPMIELSPTPLSGWGRILKRLLDIIGSGIGLIIASPVMLVISLLIKLNSKGPILFHQKRVGELGELFTFYKFRSMYTEMSTGEGFGGKEAEEYREKLRVEKNEADGPMFKITNDPRVTSVGRFIRRTSLDELPQLFNVFAGHMSLVGPRPALPEEVAQYSDAAKRRLLIKPGITGMWQVSGRNDVTFDEYVRLDTFYIENWSVWLDIKIILLTIRSIIFRTGK